MATGDALGETAARRLMGCRGDFTLEPGLSEPELDAAEQHHGFTCAADHRAFLRQILPMGPGWPDWRSPGVAGLAAQLAQPVEGVLFDVEHNGTWFETLWGPRPPTMTAALTEAARRLREVSRMIPIFSHRYLPAGAGGFGHPVLSIVQTDIICYGANLVDYIDVEFGDGGAPGFADVDCTVGFWCDLEG